MNAVQPGNSERRHLYLSEALPAIPRILQLLDRNPLSSTYGSFDRDYWHYRTSDFPTGMSQEFVLPLALAYGYPLPGNPFFGEERVREWTLAGIDFARRSAHRDGSCDDYYPHERALGAVVFSLYAMAESYRVVSADAPRLRDFLVHRSRWAMGHGESGVLTNHHAIAAAALAVMAKITGDDTFARAAGRKADEVLSHQHSEGWYREYEGFDPGYQTVTIDFLARYWKESGDAKVLPSLQSAVELLERVQHPDGTVGGEYGSRNTYHFQPHGFELLAPSMPSALRVAERYLDALQAGKRALNDDDRLIGHHVYPYLMAWRDFAPRSASSLPAAAERLHLPGCGFFVDRRRGMFLVAGLKKGGLFRAYEGSRLVANDSGPTLVLEDGRVLVAHLATDCDVEVSDDSITVRGRFHESRRELMTPTKSIVLRMIMLTAGRLVRNQIRKLLQRRLILGRRATPFSFTRRFELSNAGIRIVDEIRRDGLAPKVSRILFGVGQTSIYIAASQPWQEGWLLPWTELSERAHEFEESGSLSFGRWVGAVSDRTAASERDAGER